VDWNTLGQRAEEVKPSPVVVLVPSDRDAVPKQLD
jgi:hypothetical protein